MFLDAAPVKLSASISSNLAVFQPDAPTVTVFWAGTFSESYVSTLFCVYFFIATEVVSCFAATLVCSASEYEGSLYLWCWDSNWTEKPKVVQGARFMTVMDCHIYNHKLMMTRDQHKGCAGVCFKMFPLEQNPGWKKSTKEEINKHASTKELGVATSQVVSFYLLPCLNCTKCYVCQKSSSGMCHKYSPM